MYKLGKEVAQPLYVHVTESTVKQILSALVENCDNPLLGRLQYFEAVPWIFADPVKSLTTCSLLYCNTDPMEQTRKQLSHWSFIIRWNFPLLFKSCQDRMRTQYFIFLFSIKRITSSLWWLHYVSYWKWLQQKERLVVHFDQIIKICNADLVY